MTQRQIFIGDVHGHYDGLMKLLDIVAPTESDEIYFLGDLIDRGPKSCDVVNFVWQSGYPCLLGNHEQMLLDSVAEGRVYTPALQAWLYSGGHTTVRSYGKEGIPVEHLNWMRTLPTYLDLGDTWLVHAGIHPKIPLDQQTSEQFCWVRDEFHRIPQPYFPNKLVVIGHTITFTLPGVNPGELAQGHGWIDIDTGAYHPKSGWLTGLDVANQQVYQVNVLHNSHRTLPLSEVVKYIEPAEVHARR